MAEHFAFGNLNVDANSIYKVGGWTVATTLDSGLNVPFDYGILYCFKQGGSYPYTQIAMKRRDGLVYYRTCNIDLEWSDWILVKG